MYTTVVCLSGGMDSTTLLYLAKSQGDRVYPLSVHYGQRHARELDAARQICADLQLPWRCVELPAAPWLFQGSSQTDASVAVPEGHYAAETMKLTVVPNRNMLLLALAGAYAVSLKADRIAYAAHAGDHTIYPDCRPAFVDQMAAALALCDWHAVQLWTPFLHQTKADIVTVGQALEVPWAQTWSCYQGQDAHCGRCGTCCERREAFQRAGITDPTAYEEAPNGPLDAPQNSPV